MAISGNPQYPPPRRQHDGRQSRTRYLQSTAATALATASPNSGLLSVQKHSHAFVNAVLPPLRPSFEAPSSAAQLRLSSAAGASSSSPASVDAAIKRHSAQKSSLFDYDFAAAPSLDDSFTSAELSLNEDPPPQPPSSRQTPPGRLVNSPPPLPRLKVKVSKAARSAALARTRSNSDAAGPRLNDSTPSHQRLLSEPPEVSGYPKQLPTKTNKKRAKSVPCFTPIPNRHKPRHRPHHHYDAMPPFENMDERAAKSSAPALPHGHHHVPPSNSFSPPPPPPSNGERNTSLFVGVKKPSPSISVASPQFSDSGVFSPLEASRVASSQSSWSSYADSNVDANSAAKVSTLEAELREMAVELAASVKREMELEDTVESLHARNELPHYASFKYLQQSEKNGQDASSSPPASLDYEDYDDDEHHEYPRDVDINISGNAETRNQVDRRWLEKQRNERANGQEKAFFLSQLTQRYQDEHAKRVLAESQVQTLQAEVQQHRADKDKSADINRQLDELESTIETLLVEKAESNGSSQKVKELETALTQSNQSLADMTKQKESLDELVSKLRSEADQYRAENDSSPRKSSSRSSALAASKRASIYSPWLEEALAAKKAQMQADNMLPTREERDDVSDLSPRKRESKDFSSSPISRMNSLSKRSSIAVPPSRTPRPSSVIFNGVVSEYRDNLVKRVDDIQTQKDILHTTVKSLLARHELQEKQHKKKVRSLQEELQAIRAVNSSRSGGPHRRKGYVWEVQKLKEDVNQLRNRAMETMEQKIQCEKGLGGLKMDLDRAEEETSSLRMLLKEHESKYSTEPESTLAEVDDHNGTRGKPLETFRTSIASLEITYKQLIDSQGESGASGLEETELGTQVRHQIANHEASKRHIIQTIQRNEEQQKRSVERINDLQERLKHFEETLIQAQQHSEDEIELHEQEAALFKESNNTQLRRVMTKNRVRRDIRLPSDEKEEDEEENNSREARKSAANLLPLLTPLLNDKDGDSSELSATQFFKHVPTELQSEPKTVIRPFTGQNVPMLNKTNTGKPIALSEAVKTQAFEEHIKRLEAELQVADHDMAEVVSRMNVTQMEVGVLQNNGEEARHQRHRLKAEIQSRKGSLSSSPDYDN